MEQNIEREALIKSNAKEQFSIKIVSKIVFYFSRKFRESNFEYSIVCKYNSTIRSDSIIFYYHLNIAVNG